MTPPTQPEYNGDGFLLSPFRCDTCYNDNCEVFARKPPITAKMVEESKIANEVDKARALIFLDMTGWVGCASHSSNQSSRDTVLDEVLDAIENQKDHKEFLLSRDTKNIVLDIVDSLRQTTRAGGP